MLKFLLENIKTKRGRWVLSPIPYALFMIIVFFVEGPKFEKVIERELNAFIIVGIISLILSHMAFLFLNALIENWHRSKELRMWVFASSLWAIGVYIYVIIFEPFGGYMYGDDYTIMNVSAFIPPIFIGIGYFVYNKCIK